MGGFGTLWACRRISWRSGVRRVWLCGGSSRCRAACRGWRVRAQVRQAPRPSETLLIQTKKWFFMITKTFTRKNGGKVFVIMGICWLAGTAALWVGVGVRKGAGAWSPGCRRAASRRAPRPKRAFYWPARPGCTENSPEPEYSRTLTPRSARAPRHTQGPAPTENDHSGPQRPVPGPCWPDGARRQELPAASHADQSWVIASIASRRPEQMRSYLACGTGYTGSTAKPGSG